jgi:hypothetical protein
MAGRQAYRAAHPPQAFVGSVLEYERMAQRAMLDAYNTTNFRVRLTLLKKESPSDSSYQVRIEDASKSVVGVVVDHLPPSTQLMTRFTSEPSTPLATDAPSHLYSSPKPNSPMPAPPGKSGMALEAVALAASTKEGANDDPTAVAPALHSSAAEQPWSAGVEALFALALSHPYWARPGQQARRPASDC